MTLRRKKVLLEGDRLQGARKTKNQTVCRNRADLTLMDDCAGNDRIYRELGAGHWGLEMRIPVPSPQTRISNFVAHSQRRYQ